MKFIVFVLLLTIPFSGITQSRKYKKEIEWYKTSHKKKEQKIFRDGKLTEWTGWWENGNLKFIRTYKEHKKEGVHKEWYENGVLRQTEKYSYDTLVDTAAYYFPGGKLQYQKVYVSGSLVDDIQWLENGIKLYEEKTDPYKKIKTKTTYDYYPSNQLKAESVLTNNVLSRRTTWYPNGQKESESAYTNGRLEGEALEWYDNGQLKAKTTYVNGVAKKIEKWNINGKKENVHIITDDAPDKNKKTK